jgi:predicted lipid-binding transport protein (Tim44 family)
LFTAFSFLATEVDARSGRGGSFGSRGARTYSAPPTTNTAPKAGAPIQRSATQPSATSTGQAGRAATPSPTGGLFGRPGFLGGLAAGFLGAGLIGLLMGHGFGGGLAGLASILGLVLQVGLIALVVWLVWRWWQGRSQPAYAGPGNPQPHNFERTDYGTGATGTGGAASMMPAFAGEVAIEPEDYDEFERLLSEIQEATSNEDLDALRKRVTPEVLGYFSEDLADNASRGVVNKISDVKLLSGDLAEAWREGHVEYATVAMRFSLIDYLADRNTGRVTEGDPTNPTEATELWTFRRASGGQWMLSAIQQT